MSRPKLQILASTVGFEAVWYVLAVAVHAAALVVLPTQAAPKSESFSPDLAEIELVEQAPEPAPQDTEPQVIEAPPQPRTPKPPPEPVEPDKEPEKEPAAPADEVPFAFDEMVLSNQGADTSWTIDTRPDAVVTGRNVEGQAGGVIGGEGTGVITDLGDLSRPPKPPDLKRKLERNYPKKARGEGKEGFAQVRLQVNADGRTTRLRLVREDPADYGFGEACLRTLEDERWDPPIDDGGRRVATRVTYSCRFKVRY